ncbi:LysR family transcriptional regulator [Pseudomonas sp. HS6]|uniref:LysR family transcriptional regulator n=1 Tax=Pseudomonas sp. HS6 TaxID=2850559 RepID=UPI00201948CA|nr:LysR family transcriptional regulator [Pseudomonas sp. HS6]UQS17179.1 LysR family transcriptional regulator [Pseudomonas sp. HS6]
MKISIRHVEIFKAVMASGSITGAADALGTSQPTVSRELSSFERSMGMQLFERTKGRLKATRQGVALHNEILKTYDGLSKIGLAAAEIKQGLYEKITVVSLPILSQTLLPDSISKFLQHYPELNISLTTHDSPLLEESLSLQSHDLGLIEGSRAPMGTTAEPLLRVDEVCILPPHHPLCHQTVIDPAALANHTFVHLAPNDPYRHQLDDLFNTRGINRRQIIEVDNSATICQMVLRGVGVSIINPLAANVYASQGLQVRRLAASIPFTVSIVRPIHRGSSHIIESFIDCIRTTGQELSLPMQAPPATTSQSLRI